MPINNFSLAWRHLTRNKGYSAINIIGLAAGMAIALLIGLWVTDEMNYDHYAPNHDRLAKGMITVVAKGQYYSGDIVTMPMGDVFRTQYGDLFSRTALICGGNDQLISSGNKTLMIPALWAQPDLPAMFGFRMVSGAAGATKDPSTAIIAQSTATALFGPSDPIGQSIKPGNQIPLFTVLAIFISCLGLFGLASFVAEQRTREIGIRKVLGARVSALWGLLSKEFIKLVALSLLIAIPLSYWIMSQWLLSYLYRSPMPWWIFASAGVGILLLTLATVSYQSLKAALTNPVKSLRAE